MKSRAHILVATLTVITAACSSAPESSTPTTAAEAPHATQHTRPTDTPVAWDSLRNPIVETDWMAKDQAAVFVAGVWHLWYSTRQPGRGIGYQTSPDLLTWTVVDDRPPTGGSPDVRQLKDGRWLMTVQVDPPSPESPDRDDLAYAVADSTAALATAPLHPLAPGFFDDVRRIDAAVAETDTGLFLVFKRGGREQVPQITTLLHSPSGSLDGPWTHLGDPNVGWFENYQFLEIDGVWHLLGTRIPVHVPELWRLEGNPDDPDAWLTWAKVRDLEVPAEAWNSGDGDPGFAYERANSAYLVDHRAVDGWWYLFYAGSTELTTNEGRGHAKIGIARSRDLQTWTVPPN
jgi:hypothetical protein